MSNKGYGLALGIWALVLAGQAWADGVVMFHHAAPAAEELADIMFPPRHTAAPQLKFRGIRLTQTTPEVTPDLAQVATVPEAKAIGFNIRFAFNSAELLPETLPHLDSMGEMLKMEQAADKRVRIAGHADAAGPAAYNLQLSQARAEAVQDYLVERHGIPLGRLDVTGYGEARPLAGSNPYDGVNRRVEFAPVD